MLKRFIRFLKTSPILVPVLVLIDLMLLLIDRVAILSASSLKQNKSIIIIKLDVMGDYLMFRNYLRCIKESHRYSKYRITLLANITVKTLAESFDANVVDQFIWVDIYRLTTNPFYRFRIVKQLRSKGFSVVFCPTYSRVLVLDDYLAWATGAHERVGCKTDYSNIKQWEARLGNTLYTRLIDSGKGIQFEMERDRLLVAGFIQEPVTVQFPLLDSRYAKPVTVPSQYIVLSLGAGQNFRIWPTENFAEVAKFIFMHFPNYQILLTGAANETVFSKQFLSLLPSNKAVTDLTGRLSIPELVFVLTKADLLIANETGVAHIAASTGTESIIISQGKSLVRWHPYPASIAPGLTYVYPAFIEENRGKLIEIAPLFNPESPYAINEISTERIISLISSKLNYAST